MASAGQWHELQYTAQAVTTMLSSQWAGSWNLWCVSFNGRAVCGLCPLQTSTSYSLPVWIAAVLTLCLIAQYMVLWDLLLGACIVWRGSAWCQGWLQPTLGEPQPHIQSEELYSPGGNTCTTHKGGQTPLTLHSLTTCNIWLQISKINIKGPENCAVWGPLWPIGWWWLLCLQHVDIHV